MGVCVRKCDTCLLAWETFEALNLIESNEKAGISHHMRECWAL